MDNIFKSRVFKLSIAAGVVLIFFGASVILTRVPFSPPYSAGEKRKTAAENLVGVRHYPSEDWTYPAGGDTSAWLWDSPLTISEDKAREWLQFARQEHITTLSVSVNDIADILELADAAQRQAQTEQFQEGLHAFIRLASEYGIAVEALAGDARWGNSSHWYLPQLVLDFVIAYNAQAQPQERLVGMQFDIEPHNQEGYREMDTELVLSEYLSVVRSLIEGSARRAPYLRLGIVIPFWFDEDLPQAPAIAFQGATKPLAHHIMDMLSNHPQGYVAVMDYRNTAQGLHGAIAEAQGEFAYAAQNRLPVGIVIGFEFVKEEPAHITFHGTSRDYFVRERQLVLDAFAGEASFAGIAVHDLKHYQQLARP